MVINDGDKDDHIVICLPAIAILCRSSILIEGVITLLVNMMYGTCADTRIYTLDDFIDTNASIPISHPYIHDVGCLCHPLSL